MSFLQIGNNFNLQIPKPPQNMPFWILDLYNKELITIPFTRPGNISDTKQIILTEMEVPGLNYNPVSSGGGGNRKIAFTISLIQRNQTIGNSLILAQFEKLRNAATGNFFEVRFKDSGRQFSPRPKVVMQYITGTPMEYFVAKCDFDHKDGFINKLGYSKWTDISLEFWLDEESRLYKFQSMYQRMASFGGQFQGFGSEFFGQTSAITNRRPI